MRPHRFVVAALAVLIGAASATAAPPDKIRLGVISPVTGPFAALGNEQYMGFDLAMKELGNKLGGIPVEVFKEDSTMTPDGGLQVATRLVERDKIDFLLGNLLSNQLLAYVKPVSGAGVFILSGPAGPSELAGADCNPNLFVMSWENNTPSEAVGQYMTDSGVKRAFFLSQNFVTGKEHAAGAKHYFKGEVVGEAYVPIAQVDYAAEIAAIRAANPDGVFVFLPGAGGIAFLKQFADSGLKDKVKLFSGSWLADEHSFKAVGDAALGVMLAANWFADLDNPANRKFVADFNGAYGRNPVFYAAFIYDSVMLIDAALRTVHGEIADKTALRQALAAAQFDSVRGKFRFNVNHFPIQDFYAARVIDKNGVRQHEVVGTIFHDHKDRFYESCYMAN